MPINVFRFNVVDDSGSISFVGPAHGLKALAAACSRGPSDSFDLLEKTERYDLEWVTTVKMGLRVFDEHNVDGASSNFVDLAAEPEVELLQPFRVLDSVTRARSMRPARLGLVVINLREKRIIQVQNAYADLDRKGRGRVWMDGAPTERLYHYELPGVWSIVP